MILSASELLYRSSLKKQKQMSKQKDSTSLSLIHPLPCVSDVLCVQLHPVLQLLGDVLVPPLRQVGDDDPGVEGACVSPHA